MVIKILKGSLCAIWPHHEIIRKSPCSEAMMRKKSTVRHSETTTTAAWSTRVQCLFLKTRFFSSCLSVCLCQKLLKYYFVQNIILHMLSKYQAFSLLYIKPYACYREQLSSSVYIYLLTVSSLLQSNYREMNSTTRACPCRFVLSSDY